MIYKCASAESFDRFYLRDIEIAELGLLRASLSTIGDRMVGGVSLRSKRAVVCGEAAASSCASGLSVSSLVSASPLKPTTTNGTLVSVNSMAGVVSKKYGSYVDKGHLTTCINAMRAHSPSRFRSLHAETPEAFNVEAATYNAWLVSTSFRFALGFHLKLVLGMDLFYSLHLAPFFQHTLYNAINYCTLEEKILLISGK